MTRFAALDSTTTPDKPGDGVANNLSSLDMIQLPANQRQSALEDQKQLEGKGFPKIELLGLGTDVWAQPTQKHESQTGIKGLFSGSETLESRLQKRELKKLTPAEQAEYRKEEQAIAAWSMQLQFGVQRPDTPMHQLVQRRLDADKEQIVEAVKASLSHAERARLDAALRERANASLDGVFAADPFSRPLHKQTSADVLVAAYCKKIVDTTERMTQ